MASVNDWKLGDLACSGTANHDYNGIYLVLGHTKGNRYLTGIRINEDPRAGTPYPWGGSVYPSRVGHIDKWVRPLYIHRCDGTPEHS